MNKLLLALTQFPLLTSLWLWWDSAKARPILAVLLSVLYEILMFASAFGKKVWTELESGAVQQTANWIRRSVSRFAPGFRSRFKNEILSNYAIFNVRGLGLINTYTLPLEEIFVDLRIDPSNPQKLNIDLLSHNEARTAQPIWYYLSSKPSPTSSAFDILSLFSRPENTFLKHAALAIVGPPGSGKTTLLQHVALTFASNRHRRFKTSRSTPILLFLRDHVKAVTGDNPPSLGRLLNDYFSDGSRFPGLEPPVDWFEKELRRGKCTVLLDGLDEVAGLRYRQVISNWVDSQVKNYPLCRFVLTARPQGYRDAPLQRAHVLEVQPFTNEQVKKFVKNWYLANETKASGGNLDRDVRRRASKEAADLLQRLRMSPSLTDLTVNPLLVTMIAMVHRYHGALPETRVELYAEICEVLLGRWRQTKGVEEELTAAQKLTVLRPLAGNMMELRVRELQTKDAIPIIASPLKRLGIVGDPQSFLRDLQESSGLLLEREADHWSFAHLTFQEYLTASHWHKQNTKRQWSEMIGDSWWHETLRLYAAQGDATELVQTCLTDDTLPSLTLAAECLDGKCEIEIGVRRDVEIRVVADLESPHTDRRRFATEVQLTRRLKSLQRMDEQLEIDIGYVTSAEYQLFLDDMKKIGRSYVPDHWTEPVFESGHALNPIAGVRAADAVAFCNWLTQLLGGNSRIRLPSRSEALEYPAKSSQLASWSQDGPNFDLIGFPTKEKEAVRQQLAKLSSLPLVDNAEIFNLPQAFTEALSSVRSLHHDRREGVMQVLAPFLNLTYDLSNERDLYNRNDLTQFRELARSLILSLALKSDAKLSDAGINTLNPLIAALDRSNLDEARQIAESIEVDSKTSDQTVILLKYLLALATTEAERNIAGASQGLICRVMEFMYTKDPQALKPLLKLYWCFQILRARERTQLRPWEGIRIVRESSQLSL